MLCRLQKHRPYPRHSPRRFYPPTLLFPQKPQRPAKNSIIALLRTSLACVPARRVAEPDTEAESGTPHRVTAEAAAESKSIARAIACPPALALTLDQTPLVVWTTPETSYSCPCMHMLQQRLQGGRTPIPHKPNTLHLDCCRCLVKIHARTRAKSIDSQWTTKGPILHHRRPDLQISGHHVRDDERSLEKTDRIHVKRRNLFPSEPYLSLLSPALRYKGSQLLSSLSVLTLKLNNAKHVASVRTDQTYPEPRPTKRNGGPP